jgi:hypothetical protein
MPRKITSLRAYLFAIAAGVVTFAAVYGIDFYLARVNLPAEKTVLDDAILAVLVVLIVIGIQRQSELREHRHKITVIAEMNHHIRNALQIIMYTSFNVRDRDEADKLRDAAKRIEWALREILPAEPSERQECKTWPPIPPKNSL